MGPGAEAQGLSYQVGRVAGQQIRLVGAIPHTQRACSPSRQRSGMAPGPPHLCISVMTPDPSVRKYLFLHNACRVRPWLLWGTRKKEKTQNCLQPDLKLLEWFSKTPMRFGVCGPSPWRGRASCTAMHTVSGVLTPAGLQIKGENLWWGRLVSTQSLLWARYHILESP